MASGQGHDFFFFFLSLFFFSEWDGNKKRGFFVCCCCLFSFTFNVAMEFAFGVKVLQALEHFAEDDGDLHFVEIAGLHQVEGRTAAQVLHNDPQFRLLRGKTNQIFDFFLYFENGNNKMMRGQIKLNIPFYFEVGSVITSDVRAVALRQHHDLLLNVFDFIFGFLQVDDFNSHNLLRPVVDAFKHFAERALADALLFREDQFRIHFLDIRITTRNI